MPEHIGQMPSSVKEIGLPSVMEFRLLGEADAINVVKTSWGRYFDFVTGTVFSRLSADAEVMATYNLRKDDIRSLTVAEGKLLVERCLRYQEECYKEDDVSAQLRVASKEIQEKYGVSFYNLRQPSVDRYPKDGFRYHMLVGGTPKGEHIINDMKRMFDGKIGSENKPPI